MSKFDYRNIEKVTERCGGSAVIAGMRIRVSIILGCYRQGMTVEEIVQQYPSLSPGDVHDDSPMPMTTPMRWRLISPR